MNTLEHLLLLTIVAYSTNVALDFMYGNLRGRADRSA